jgi:hypothetical protein
MAHPLPTTKVEADFLAGLRTFQKEADTFAVCFYGADVINVIAAENNLARGALSKYALLWSTIVHSMQVSSFIALHRLFDTDSQGRADTLLAFAADHCGEIFSKSAFLTRYRVGLGAEYLHPDGIYEPSPTEFQKLRGEVRKLNKLYDDKYRKIRSGVYAHLLLDNNDQFSLFRQTSLADMQRFATFFVGLHDALRDLFYNATQPVLRSEPLSTKEILEKAYAGPAAHEQVVHQAAEFLRGIAEAGQPAPTL